MTLTRPDEDSSSDVTQLQPWHSQESHPFSSCPNSEIFVLRKLRWRALYPGWRWQPVHKGDPQGEAQPRRGCRGLRAHLHLHLGGAGLKALQAHYRRDCRRRCSGTAAARACPLAESPDHRQVFQPALGLFNATSGCPDRGVVHRCCTPGVRHQSRHRLLPLIPADHQRGPGSGPIHGLRRSVRTPGRWSGSSSDRPVQAVGSSALQLVVAHSADSGRTAARRASERY